MRALCLWRREETSSLHLFRVDSSGRQMIRNFSLRQRLYICIALWRNKTLLYVRIEHSIGMKALRLVLTHVPV